MMTEDDVFDGQVDPWRIAQYIFGRHPSPKTVLSGLSNVSLRWHDPKTGLHRYFVLAFDFIEDKGRPALIYIEREGWGRMHLGALEKYSRFEGKASVNAALDELFEEDAKS